MVAFSRKGGGASPVLPVLPDGPLWPVGPVRPEEPVLPLPPVAPAHVDLLSQGRGLLLRSTKHLTSCLKVLYPELVMLVETPAH